MATDFEFSKIKISDIPENVVPSGFVVVVGFDPAYGDSVTAIYDPVTGEMYIQSYTEGSNGD